MQLQHPLQSPEHDQRGALLQLLVLEEVSKLGQRASVTSDAHARRQSLIKGLQRKLSAMSYLGSSEAKAVRVLVDVHSGQAGDCTAIDEAGDVRNDGSKRASSERYALT